jgi:hypothetical protein
VKLTDPTDHNGLLTIRCEVNGATVVAHIAPWSISTVAAVDNLLVIRFPGVDPIQFPCETAEVAEDFAGQIADHMEKARTGES